MSRLQTTRNLAQSGDWEAKSCKDAKSTSGRDPVRPTRSATLVSRVRPGMAKQTAERIAAEALIKNGPVGPRALNSSQHDRLPFRVTAVIWARD
jgi:hypothetical protein